MLVGCSESEHFQSKAALLPILKMPLSIIIKYPKYPCSAAFCWYLDYESLGNLALRGRL